MSWKDLLETGDEQVVAPWLGGRVLRVAERKWEIQGRVPQEHGWYAFRIIGRKAYPLTPRPPALENLKYPVIGYLVGDRLVPDSASAAFNPVLMLHDEVIGTVDAKKVLDQSEPVHLLDPGLERFSRISAGRVYEGGPLIYKEQAFPLGPETEVLSAYQDGLNHVDHIKGVSPALAVAFWFERWTRIVAERQRAEVERLRREEEERAQKEELRQKIVKQLGDGAGRRALAPIDFEHAARAALAIGNATLLDFRPSTNKDEMVVDFRLEQQKFQCTCDKRTLRIIDSGICLTEHRDDNEDFEYGTKTDNFFTLESLPSVIREAIRGHKLVVYRRVR